jgi:DNA-3-methyladenine glycosylase I
MSECSEGYINGNLLLQKYHDEEWGRPEHDEKKLYEMFLLELFQAGLSWQIILKKRENFRKAFSGFNVKKIAAYDDAKIESLLKEEGIIRSRGKIQAAVNNAKIVLQIQKEYGSFEKYLWHYTDGKPIYESLKITRDTLSDDVSNDLKKRGMKYCGSVTIYSFLQAVGIIYSHTRSCPCFKRDHGEKWIHRTYRTNKKTGK